ncbi:hypothetical protein NERG_01101 [Nematocida ausubeli]|uniref:Asparagine synthetase domain-containing protein n=1 Tax=Nematocida ausubeli (strain ATCC PRA-371 / ERTm2) TaxID=1913371 RepID=H8ZCV4_NEMA1|nr:hypothetical protein NERG_01101 [Nematocida ausubeli]
MSIYAYSRNIIQEILQKQESLQMKDISINISEDVNNSEVMDISVCSLETLLFNSLKNILDRITDDTNRIFISYSGGIDSLLCAMLCLKYFTHKVFLINTAFSCGDTWASRDRETAKEGYTYILGRVQDTSRCVLVQNNITREEIIARKEDILSISDGTTMDFNLAALHFFTARKTKELGGTYIITGSGADELFMGYSRHRKIAEEKGAVPVNNSEDKADISMICKDIINQRKNHDETTFLLVRQIITDISGFWESNLQRDCRAGMLCGVLQMSPFLNAAVLAYALETCCAERVEKKELVEILHREYPDMHIKKKLAGQFGSGISNVVRSIRCRAHTLCRNNECLSLECTKYTRDEK